MYLTDFQKAVVKSIHDEEVTDIESFINKFIKGEKKPFRGKAIIGERAIFIEKNFTLLIPNNVHEAHKLCKDFKLLLIILQRNDLVVLNGKSINEQVKINFFGSIDQQKNPINNTELDDILKEFFLNDIFSTPDLKTFIENGYLTSQEFVIKEEKKDRIKAQRWTIAIALISIIISPFLNYMLNKKIEIKVENLPDIRDTVYVELITKIPKDSTKFYFHKELVDSLKSDVIKNK